MEIKSIRFYAQVPGSPDPAPTYFAVSGKSGNSRITQLSMEITVGPQATLQITQTTDGREVKVFIYQLADVMGRIEVTK